jgi:hypothetical protein
MPRNITAILEDGTSLTYQGVPDTVRPEEILSRIQREHGQGVRELTRGAEGSNPSARVGTERGRGTNATQPSSVPMAAPLEPPAPKPSGIWDTVKSLGADLARGAGSTASFLAEGAGAFNDTQSALGGKSKTPTSYNELTERVRSALPTPDPETEGAGRKYLRAGLESIGGGAVMPLGGLGPAAQAANFVSGISGEAVGNLLPNTGGVGKLLGGLAGGYGTSLGLAKLSQAIRPNAANLAKTGLEGILPEDLARATALQELAARNGTSLDLVQALKATGTDAGNLSQIRESVASSRRGAELQQRLRDQPKELETLAEATVGGMPGKVRAGDVAANNLQDAATARIEQARGDRSALWVDTLEKGKATLRDLANISIADAKTKLPALEMSVGQARAKLSAAQQDLEGMKAQILASRGADASAVAGQNAAVQQKTAEIKNLLEGLQTFTLPRGRTVSNQGQLLPLGKRGDSIGLDMLSREGQIPGVERKLAEVSGEIPLADSLQTAALKARIPGLTKAVEGTQAGVNSAESALAQGKLGVTEARGKMAAVEAVPQDTAMWNLMELRHLAQKFPNTAQGRMMTSLAQRLTGADGLPLTDAGQINQVLKEATAKLKSPDLATQGVDAATAKWVGGQIGSVRERLGATFEPLRNANAAFKEFTEDTIDPLKKGLVGDFATPRGSMPDRAASTGRLRALLDAGEDPNVAQSNIRGFAKELTKVDAEAFPDALKTYLSGKVQSALPANTSADLTTPDLAQKLHAALFSNKLQYNGLRQAAAASAESLGENPADVVRGLDNFAKITTALKSRPAVNASVSSGELRDIGGASYMAAAAKTLGITPFGGFSRWIKDVRLGQSLKEFDIILTSPEGAKRLAELGRAKPSSQQALEAFAALGTGPANYSAGANSPGVTRE